jgi:hypothetical protein
MVKKKKKKDPLFVRVGRLYIERTDVRYSKKE